MKLHLIQRPPARAAREFNADPGSENEILRLAADILDADGECPAIDVPGASLDHWNGHAIALARADIDDLLARGLIDSAGHWTDHGRLALSRHADVEASAA